MYMYGERCIAPERFLGENALLGKPIVMHDNHGSSFDEKTHVKPTYMQSLESIRSL